MKKFSLKSKPPKRASSNDKLFADVSIEAFSIFVHPILSAIAFFEEINKLWNNWIIATRLTVSSLTKIAYWFFKLDNRDSLLKNQKIKSVYCYNIKMYRKFFDTISNVKTPILAW